MQAIFKDLSILVVDDSKTMRALVRRMLLDLGFDREKMDEASSGLAALDKIEEDRKSYDLILMDWTMPGMNGIQTLRTIRSMVDEKLASMPVIMVTAEGLKKNVIAAAESGANGYIVKPFKAEKLLETMENVLRKATT